MQNHASTWRRVESLDPMEIENREKNSEKYIAIQEVREK